MNVKNPWSEKRVQNVFWEHYPSVGSPKVKEQRCCVNTVLEKLTSGTGGSGNYNTMD